VNELQAAAKQKLGDIVRIDEPMYRHTSLRVGGPAEIYARPRDEIELIQILQFAKDNNIPFTVIGGGTNVVVSSAGILGITLDPRGINDQIERRFCDGDAEEWEVGAGVPTVKLVREAVQFALKGAEVLAGVPGSVGGAVFMNAGGHVGEIKDVIIGVRIVDAQGARWLPVQEVGFSYRGSQFPKQSIITAVKMKLIKNQASTLSSFVQTHMKRRQLTQPLQQANAGSFFKNPKGDFAGRLIEQCGLKKTRIGSAEVSNIHANFLVNWLPSGGQGASQDFVKLVDLVRQTLWDDRRVWLEFEVKFVGEFSSSEREVLTRSPVGEVTQPWLSHVVQKRVS